MIQLPLKIFLVVKFQFAPTPPLTKFILSLQTSKFKFNNKIIGKKNPQMHFHSNSSPQKIFFALDLGEIGASLQYIINSIILKIILLRSLKT